MTVPTKKSHGRGGPSTRRYDADPSRKRMATVFGWVAGGALGLLVSYVLFLVAGSGYPVVLATFVLFVGGAFGGMWLADRLGARGFRPLGIAAGILFALAVTLVLAVAMSPSAG